MPELIYNGATNVETVTEDFPPITKAEALADHTYWRAQAERSFALCPLYQLSPDISGWETYLYDLEQMLYAARDYRKACMVEQLERHLVYRQSEVDRLTECLSQPAMSARNIDQWRREKAAAKDMLAATERRLAKVVAS